MLVTKLYVPQISGKPISRPRLTARLNDALTLHHKVVLISAAAGSGKTTLVSQWILQELDRRAASAAWLSLDSADGEPARFLSHVIAAIQVAAPAISDVADHLLPALQAVAPPTPETVLAALLNEVAALENNIVLVLDDYQVIENLPTHVSLNFLVDHLPHNMLLVITTREDPPLPLARLRVGREMTELRGRDLAFTADEIARFLNGNAQLDLSDEEVTALEQRTEGWIAGIQLAALSMQGLADVSQFISDFNGDDRYVVDYLFNEVIDRQPPEIQEFLLKTSILEKLNVALCNAVTERDDAREMIDFLLRHNLFLVPLDHRGEWYRYHHLFANLLRYQLEDTHLPRSSQFWSSLWCDLHRRAADWYRAHDQLDDSMYHLLRAEDFEAAADLAADCTFDAIRNAHLNTASRWLTALPECALRARSRLCLDLCWLHHFIKPQDRLPVGIHLAEHALETPPSNSGRQELDAHRAFFALQQGDCQQAATLLHSSRTAVPVKPDPVPAALFDFVNLEIDRANQDIQRMETHCGLAMQSTLETGLAPYHLLTMSRSAWVDFMRGHTRSALDTYRRCMEIVTDQNWHSAPFADSIYLDYAGLLYELNQLEEAAAYVKKSALISNEHGHHQLAMVGLLLAADLRSAADQEAEPEAAFLDPVVRRRIGATQDGTSAVWQRLGAWQARQWVRRGDLPRAADWFRLCGLSLDTSVEPSRLQAQLDLARFHIAAGLDLPPVLKYLEAAHEQANHSGALRRVAEIELLQALALDKAETPTIATLETALTLAQSAQLVRLFLDEGQPALKLLRRTRHPYARHLLSQLASPRSEMIALTSRELEVLRLYANGLTRAEIADQLFLSTNSVKWHLKNIYEKLGVNRRAEAMRKARQFGLLSD